MNADLNISAVVYSRIRLWDEPFRPTRMDTNDFQIFTDLEGYAEAVEPLSVEVYNYVTEQRQLGEVTLHVYVRMSNPTHPDTAAGVIPLAKGAFDAKLSGNEILAADSVSQLISSLVANLKAGANY